MFDLLAYEVSDEIWVVATIDLLLSLLAELAVRGNLPDRHITIYMDLLKSETLLIKTLQLIDSLVVLMEAVMHF